MTQTIVIAEMSNNTVHASTAELVSAAIALGGHPTLVVPCTDASQADGAAGMGQIASSLPSRAPSPITTPVVGGCPRRCRPQGTVITGASPQSKTWLHASPHDVVFPSCKTPSPSMATTSPLPSTAERPCRPYRPPAPLSSRYAQTSLKRNRWATTPASSPPMAMLPHRFKSSWLAHLSAWTCPKPTSSSPVDEAWVHPTISPTSKQSLIPSGAVGASRAAVDTGRPSPTQCKSAKPVKRSIRTSTSL